MRQIDVSQANTPADDAFLDLPEHIRHLRRDRPIPPRADLSRIQEARCRINGGSLIAWLERQGPGFLQERSFWHPEEGPPPIAFTSDMSGLVAAREILGPKPKGIVYLLHSEFERVLRRPGFPVHGYVHFWARFLTRVPAELRPVVEESFPLDKGSRYWIHAEGTVWGPLAGQGLEHLWEWNGNEAKLLKEAITEWIS